MSLTRIDWSHGPVPCSGCGRPMRPGHREPVADWADTTIYGGHGCCRACRKRQRTAGGGVSETGSTRRVRYSHHAQPVHLGTPMVYLWHALPGAVPMIHQEHEAIADLMDHLHPQGLLLCSRPRVEVRHGQHMTLRLHVQVRRAIGMVPDALKGGRG